MRYLLGLVGLFALLFAGAWALGLVSLRQTQVARAPALKVEGGQAPAFKVDVAKVALGTENRAVDIPAIATERREVKVPVLHVTKPDNESAPAR